MLWLRADRLSRYQLSTCSSTTCCTCSLLACLLCSATPNTIGGLTSLQTLNLQYCGSLTGSHYWLSRNGTPVTLAHNCIAFCSVARTIGGLVSLRTLHLEGCTSLTGTRETALACNPCMLQPPHLYSCSSTVNCTPLLPSVVDKTKLMVQLPNCNIPYSFTFGCTVMLMMTLLRGGHRNLDVRRSAYPLEVPCECRR